MAQRTTSPAPTRETEAIVIPTGRAVVYDAETRDFAMYFDGELVGFARTPREAEDTLDSLQYEILTMRHGSI